MRFTVDASPSASARSEDGERTAEDYVKSVGMWAAKIFVPLAAAYYAPKMFEGVESLKHDEMLGYGIVLVWSFFLTVMSAAILFHPRLHKKLIARKPYHEIWELTKKTFGLCPWSPFFS